MQRPHPCVQLSDGHTRLLGIVYGTLLWRGTLTEAHVETLVCLPSSNVQQWCKGCPPAMRPVSRALAGQVLRQLNLLPRLSYTERTVVGQT